MRWETTTEILYFYRGFQIGKTEFPDDSLATLGIFSTPDVSGRAYPSLGPGRPIRPNHLVLLNWARSPERVPGPPGAWPVSWFEVLVMGDSGRGGFQGSGGFGPEGFENDRFGPGFYGRGSEFYELDDV